MNDFSLSRPKDKAFPVEVINKSGERYPINTNFRNILKILRLYDDNEVIERQKKSLMLRWFYTEHVPPNINEAVYLMNTFIVRKPNNENEASKPQFDYEFDAEEIYTSFVHEYSVDLFEIDYMHWHKFQLLLLGLSSESAFYQKIALRFADLKNYKGEQHAKMSRAKRKVQIPIKFTKEEKAAIDEMLNKLRGVTQWRQMVQLKYQLI